jgi:hypothetical protein
VARRVGTSHCRSPVHGLPQESLPGRTTLESRNGDAARNIKNDNCMALPLTNN